MPPLSYCPAGPSNTTDSNDTTLGQITTITPNADGSWPDYNVVGYFADAGEVADCLNQLVRRILVLEALNNITGN